jgi:tellurite resistance protein TerC
MITSEMTFFALFIVFIVTILMVDLGLFNKNVHEIKFKEASIWCVVWLMFAFGFYFFLTNKGELIHSPTNINDLHELTVKYKHSIDLSTATDYNSALKIYNKNLGLEFLTGYLIEYALSVDNVFVMVLIFMAFGMRKKHYKRVLFWGILGAIVLRFIFIFTSSALISHFHWILYIFGGFLILTGIWMFYSRNKEEKIEPQNHPIVKFTSKYFNVFPRNVRNRFFIRKKKMFLITPLFIVLLVIEFSDVIFAVDSIPAIFSVTNDPFIVFFSNIFAIIGLRSLFFLVMNVIDKFHYLKVGLSILLTFIGVKMLLADWLKGIGFTTAYSLYFVLLILIVSVLASLIFPKKAVEIVDEVKGN